MDHVVLPYVEASSSSFPSSLHSTQTPLLLLLLSKSIASEKFPASHILRIEKKSEKKGKEKRKNPILMKNFLEKERF